MECISAISTAPGTGGVAIIRISGENALSVAEKMFFPAGKTAVKDFEPYRMYVGEIDATDFRDKGMCVYFKAPKSFTGENVIELHCHGGEAIAHGILEKTFDCGARPATNGEFTKRAFLNGKLSLSSCEGLIDMINSESVAQIKSGFYLFKEKLRNRIEAVQSVLTDVLAGIDANIDYPEEGLITDDGAAIKEKLLAVEKDVKKLVDSYSEGRILVNGIKVALVGKTNTGKSSLLNALTGEQRAIVTDIEGTTRDVVEGNLQINGVKFTVYDTAGIRETNDPVELLGIKRSKDLINASDVILYVTDGTESDGEVKRFISELTDKKYVIVKNKSDLSSAEKKSETDKNSAQEPLKTLAVSCLTGENIEKLKNVLYKLGANDVRTDGGYVTEKRHYYALKDSLEPLESAINAIGVQPLDLISYDVKACWEKLGEITGTTASERIIDEIFSKFCVGK